MLLRCVVSLAFLFSISGLTSMSGQNLSVGLVGGGAATNAFDTERFEVSHAIDTYSQAKDYLAGVTLEYRLPWNLSIEADGLYRELHLTVAFVEPNLVLNSVSPSPVVTWELPVLAKYRFHAAGKVDPFIEAGPAFRTTGNLNANPSHRGVSAGLGVAMHWKGFEISPAVRYTRWVHDQPLITDGSKSDQLELLVGISRPAHSVWRPLGSRFALGLIAGTTLIHDVPSNSNPFSAIFVSGTVVQQLSGTQYESGADSFLAGPSLEIGLPKEICSLELDAINATPFESSGRVVLNDGSIFAPFSGTEASTWEFPVLAKYKFGSRRFKPFAEAGPAFRTPAERSSLIRNQRGKPGVEVRLRSALEIAPAIRYTRWKQQAGPVQDEIRLNQVEFLTEFLLPKSRFMALLRLIVFHLVVFLSFLIPISAQNLSVGLAAGGAVTNAFETEKPGVPGTFDTYSQFKDYLVGVTLEYRLPWNLSIEGDALRRELDLTQAFVEPNLALNDIQHLAVVTWEVPVLAKYRFHWSKVEPFIEAGPSYRTTGNRSANPSHYGVSAGVGVAMHWKEFEIAPVVRYTHWAHDQTVFADASKPDQLELLVSISRRTPSDLHALGPRVSFGGMIAGATFAPRCSPKLKSVHYLLSERPGDFAGIRHRLPVGYEQFPRRAVVGAGVAEEAIRRVRCDVPSHSVFQPGCADRRDHSWFVFRDAGQNLGISAAGKVQIRGPAP